MAITSTKLTANELPRFYNLDQSVGKSAIDAKQLNTFIQNKFLTAQNSIVDDLTTLDTGVIHTTGNETKTGILNFATGITFDSGIGLRDAFFIINSDNVGAGEDGGVRIDRGSDSANAAELRWDETNDLWKFTTDQGTTLAKLKVANGAATDEVVTYAQVVRSTGTQTGLAGDKTWTGIHTFNELPTMDAYEAPTTDAKFALKKYVDDTVAGASMSGIFQQSIAPSHGANRLWVDTTTLGNLVQYRSDGTQFDPITGIFQGSSAPTIATPRTGHTWLDTAVAGFPVFKRYETSAWKTIGNIVTIPRVVALTDAATIATDASLGTVFTVTLGGNRTLGNPTNAVNGQLIIWKIKQDGTGNRTLALGTKFRFNDTLTSFTASTAANDTDILQAIYDSTDDKFDVVGIVKGIG